MNRQKLLERVARHAAERKAKCKDKPKPVRSPWKSEPPWDDWVAASAGERAAWKALVKAKRKAPPKPKPIRNPRLTPKPPLSPTAPSERRWEDWITATNEERAAWRAGSIRRNADANAAMQRLKEHNRTNTTTKPSNDNVEA